MQSFKYIKNMLAIYLVSSAILGFTLFSLIMLHRYSNHLSNTLGVMKNISSSKNKVRGQIDKMEAIIKYLKDDLRLGADGEYSDIPFFQRLDDIKTNLKDASISIAKFEESAEERILPVQITVPVKNYNMLVDYAGYVESFIVPPVYRIKGFSISRDQEGNVVLNIQGALKAPVSKGKNIDG